jgi:sensor histidine kinase YesM
MKLMKPPKLELYTFLFSMPLIAMVLNLIMYDENWKSTQVWLVSFPFLFLLGTITWYFHVLYADWAERKFPGLEQTGQRVFMKMFVMVFVMTPAVGIIFFLYDHFRIFGYQFRQVDLIKGLFTGLSVNLIFETLYEADYIFAKYKETASEKDTLIQMQFSQEFDTLKSQVNPHFLFNCFNTLSSLITVDKEKAELFLDELSKVYRYLLRNNQEGVSTVENEIKFIESYFRLLQTRHGEAVQLNMQIDKEYYPYMLPSLTLQLLVENVVKHNSLSKTRPLQIDIFTTTGNKLVVSNNLQRRTVKAASHGVGLENIKAKYQLLKVKDFQIIEDNKNFTVVLPLIWKPAMAG